MTVVLTASGDAPIRKVLMADLSRRHGGHAGTLIVEELGVCGTARVDVAVINGHLQGYEIKSDADTLARLLRQAGTYNTVFDHLTLVAGSRHIEKAYSLLPAWWGLEMVSVEHGSPVLATVREAATNPSLDGLAIASLLWRDEALEELAARGLDRGLRGKRRLLVHRALADACALPELCAVVRQRLKRRTKWRADAQRT